MTPFDVLKRVTEFTRTQIAPTLLMRKETRHSGDLLDATEVLPEYTQPDVCYGTMPHKNFQPLDFQIPMIMWTFDEVRDDGDYSEGRTVNLRAYVGAYSSELYQCDTKLPDNKAFVDLINALEKMYIELSRHHVINGVGIQKPINYGIYDGAYYPYAYGWLTITAEIERVKYDDEINLDDYFNQEE